MSYWLRDIPVRRCPCGKRACVVLMNSSNAPIGDFCVQCGKAKLRALNKAEAKTLEG